MIHSPEKYNYAEKSLLSTLPNRPGKQKVVLCLYVIETGCVLPFVKYVITGGQNSFPSFTVDVPFHVDGDLFIKNECFRRILSFVLDLHTVSLDFGAMYRGFLCPGNDCLYFFGDMSPIRLKPQVSFGIIDEIKENGLFSHYPFLLTLSNEKGEKIPSPSLYYPHYNDTQPRWEHSVYGDFFYFSKSNEKQRRFAVFDADKKDGIHPLSCRMFTFQENETVLCVKNLLYFYPL
jgi:hypothetical protein